MRAIFLVLLVATFASCQKNYTCSCTTPFKGTGASTTSRFASGADAAASCREMEIANQELDSTTTCVSEEY